MGRHRKPTKNKYTTPIIAVVVATSALMLAFMPSVGNADTNTLDPMTTQLTNCQRMLVQAKTSSEKTWANNCINMAKRVLGATPTPTGSQTPTTTPSITPTSTPTIEPTPTSPPPPSPTPSPTPSSTPPVNNAPTFCGDPNSNTGWQGTGVTLTPKPGSGSARPFVIDAPGSLWVGYDFVDGVEVRANNVTIQNSRVQGKNTGPGAGIWIDAGISGTEIIRTEIRSQDGYDPNVEASIVDRAITAFKTTGTVMDGVCAHDIIRGLQFGCGTIIRNSWIGREVNPAGDHMSAIGGETCVGDFNLTVNNNTVNLSPNDQDSAALLYYPPQVGPTGDQNANISITNNTINGGTYCLWLSSDPGLHGTALIQNNVFGNNFYTNCGRFGVYFTDNLFKNPPEGHLVVTWTGNTRSNGDSVDRPTS